MTQLFHLGAIDNDGKLTKIGKQMSAFPLEPNYSRVLLAGIELGVKEEILNIIAMLSVEHIWISPFGDSEKEKAFSRKKELYQKYEESWPNEVFGDQVFLLDVFLEWKNKGDQWAKHYFLKPKLLKEASQIKQQLLSEIKRIDLVSQNDNENRQKNIFSRISEAFVYGHALGSKKIVSSKHVSKRSDYVYITNSHHAARVHPTSSLYFSDRPMPNWIFFTEISSTSHVFLNNVCSVAHEIAQKVLENKKKVSLDRLFQGHGSILDMLAEQQRRKESQTEEKPVTPAEPIFIEKRNNDSSVQLARERFLKRKENDPKQKKKN